VAKGLPHDWVMNDEWYSFKTNPRAAGAHVIATLDERTYSPVGMMKMDLRMGDHPIAWTNCIGKGRMFYSAIGHRPETYSEPHYVAMLEAAIDWAAISGKTACRAGK
jgi:type 1 glutamine amidotransferase